MARVNLPYQTDLSILGLKMDGRKQICYNRLTTAIYCNYWEKKAQFGRQM